MSCLQLRQSTTEYHSVYDHIHKKMARLLIFSSSVSSSFSTVRRLFFSLLFRFYFGVLSMLRIFRFSGDFSDFPIFFDFVCISFGAFSCFCVQFAFLKYSRFVSAVCPISCDFFSYVRVSARVVHVHFLISSGYITRIQTQLGELQQHVVVEYLPKNIKTQSARHKEARRVRAGIGSKLELADRFGES